MTAAEQFAKGFADLTRLQLQAVEHLLTGRIRWWQTWTALALTGVMAATYLLTAGVLSLVVMLWTGVIFLWFLFSEVDQRT